MTVVEPRRSREHSLSRSLHPGAKVGSATLRYKIDFRVPIRTAYAQRTWPPLGAAVHRGQVDIDSSADSLDRLLMPINAAAST